MIVLHDGALELAEVIATLYGIDSNGKSYVLEQVNTQSTQAGHWEFSGVNELKSQSDALAQYGVNSYWQIVEPVGGAAPNVWSVVVSGAPGTAATVNSLTTATIPTEDSGGKLYGGFQPAPDAGYITPPAVPATTVTYTNAFDSDAAVTVSGGTVTVIAVDGHATGITSGTVIVPVGKTIAITYSVAPSWNWVLF